MTDRFERTPAAVRPDAKTAAAGPAGPGSAGSLAGLPQASSAELALDPHEPLARHRERSTLLALDGARVMVLRMHDVLALTTDPRTIQMPGERYADHHAVPSGRTREFLEQIMLLSNGPEHAARRQPFARTFAHTVMRDARPTIAAAARRVMADMPRGTPFDFTDEVAARLPVELIAAILGLPEEDGRVFGEKTYAFARCLSASYPLDQHGEIEAAAEWLHAYLLEALERRRREPNDDLLTKLATGPETLETNELVVQLMGVLLAGSDTTRASFATMASLLIADGDAWAAVRDDRSLVPGAVAEAMRFEPAVAGLPRLTVAPIEIDGHLLPAGAFLALSTLSAMRDPAVYAEPDRFDIRRTDHPRLHAVFGGGPHRCLGEALARIELEEALDALLDAAPGLRVIEPPRMVGAAGIRGITPMTAIA